MKDFFKKLWNGWKKVAHKIALVQTKILVSLFYFLILVPLGALFRIFGWDPLDSRGFYSSKLTNWKEVTSKEHTFESLKRQS
ncbi:MAG TPA: hypothetical protein VHP63_06360 [candidate division Zixibacteria bacterium]|nr:hypothetical protein [candidate division Zixibacteria bacterium]